MARVNMSQPDPSLTAGVDFWEVKASEEKHSQKDGSLMFAVEFRRVSKVPGMVRDWIMLEGNGWGMGKKKLQALGISDTFEGDLQAPLLVGRRVYLGTKVEAFDGEDQLKVDVKQLTHRGYQPESDPPEGFGRATKKPDDFEDHSVPF